MPLSPNSFYFKASRVKLCRPDGWMLSIVLLIWKSFSDMKNGRDVATAKRDDHRTATAKIEAIRRSSKALKFALGDCYCVT